MATNVFELFAKLGLDSTEYEKGLNNARGLAEKSGSGIGNAIGKGVKVIGAALAAGATAVTVFCKSSADESISFETAFTGVMKTVDETAKTTYEDLANAIKMMSTQTASSKEVIAGVMEVGGQLGITADNLAEFSKAIIMLSDSTNLTAEEGAVALARFMNITRSAPSDIGRLGSAIVDLGNNFATDEASIVAMSTRLAASGTIAGLTAPEILALATAMSSVGIEAEAGGTAMSQVLTKIGNAIDNGGEKLETFAKVAGMSANEFSERWKTSPVEALSAFIVGLNNTIESGGNVSELLDELGIKGIRESNMVKSLALANDVLTTAVNTSNEAYQKNTALTEEATKRYETTESKISQMKEAYKNLKIVIGDELTPTVRDFADSAKEKILSLVEVLQNGGLSSALESIRGAFDRVKEALSPLTTKIAELAANEKSASEMTNFLKGVFDLFVEVLHFGAEALAFVIDKIGALVEWLSSGSTSAEAMKVAVVALIAGFAAFEGVNAILGLVRGAFLALNAVMAANPIALVVAAVAALAAGFVYLYNTNETFKNFVDTAWVSIKNVIVGAIENIKAGLQALGEFFAPLIESIKNFLSSLLEFVKSAVGVIGDFLKSFYESHKMQIDAFCTTVKTVVTTAIDLIKGILTTAFTYIRDAVKGTIDFVSGILNTLSSLLKGDFKGAWEAAKETVKTFKENVVETITHLGENIGKTLGDLAKNALNWGKDMLANFVNGIKEKWNDLKQAVHNTAQKIKDFLGFSKPKEGPLSDADTYGGDFIKLWINGMNSETSNLSSAVSNVAKAVHDAISKTWEGAKTLGSNLIEKIRGGLSEKANDVVSIASKVAENTRDVFSKGWNKADAIGSNFISKITNGFSSKTSALVDNVSKVVDGIKNVFTRFSDSAQKLGEGIIGNIRNGIASRVSEISSAMSQISGSLNDVFRNLASSASSWGRDLIGNFVDGLNAKLSELRDRAVAIAQQIRDVIGFSEPKEGPLSNFHTYAPDMMELFAKGIKDNEGLVKSQIEKSFDFGSAFGSSFSNGTIVSTAGNTENVGGQRQQPAVLMLDRTILGRVVYDLYNEEAQRVGVKLAGGIA